MAKNSFWFMVPKESIMVRMHGSKWPEQGCWLMSFLLKQKELKWDEAINLGILSPVNCLQQGSAS